MGVSKVRVYVSNNGMRTLFHEGPLSKETWNEIMAWVKAYFGWQKVTVLRIQDGICLMNAEKIARLRKEFFEKKEVAV